MRYTSVGNIHLVPGESKAVDFVDEDGNSYVFIVSVPAAPHVDVITVITHDAVFEADPVSPCGDYPAPCNCDDPLTHNGHGRQS